jgi:hypothetical protein
MLNNTLEVSRKIKEEHQEHQLNMMLYDDVEHRIPLSKMVNLDIQKPTQGSGYRLLLPKEKDGDGTHICYKQTTS